MTDLVKCLDDHAVRTQCSHPDCNACAREFFRWWKTREAQMSNASTGPSFQQAAVTSVRPVRPAVGAAVRVRSFGHPHTAVVRHNVGPCPLNDQHWVQVRVTYGGGRVMATMHFPASDLDDQPRNG